MHLKLKALAGDVPVEISVKPDPCDRQLDRHSVILSDAAVMAQHAQVKAAQVAVVEGQE